MKKILFILSALMLSVTCFAQETIPSDSSFVIDLGTFTGIVAVVSTLVTQITKVVPAISDSKLIKILISVATGIVVCMLCWLLKATPLLNGLVWWQSLLYGLAVGLSGCGFYDIIKAIGGLFSKKE